MFDKMKSLMDMQKKMLDMKRDLDNTTFEIASSCGLVKIKMNGSQELKEIFIEGELSVIPKDKLERALKDAISRAIKRSHDLGAQKMKEQIGFKLPGL